MTALSQLKSRFLLPLLASIANLFGRAMPTTPAYGAAMIAVTVAASGNPTGA